MTPEPVSFQVMRLGLPSRLGRGPSGLALGALFPAKAPVFPPSRCPDAETPAAPLPVAGADKSGATPGRRPRPSPGSDLLPRPSGSKPADAGLLRSWATSLRRPPLFRLRAEPQSTTANPGRYTDARIATRIAPDGRDRTPRPCLRELKPGFRRLESASPRPAPGAERAPLR